MPLGLSDITNERLEGRGIQPLPGQSDFEGLDAQFIDPEVLRKIGEAGKFLIPGGGLLPQFIPDSAMEKAAEVAGNVAGGIQGAIGSVIPGGGLINNLINNWDNNLSPGENIRNWLLLIFFCIMILVGIFGLLLPEQTGDLLGSVATLIATKGAV